MRGRARFRSVGDGQRLDGFSDTDEVAAALRNLAAKAKASTPVALQGPSVSDADWNVFGSGTHDGIQELLVGTGHWSATGPGRDGEYAVLQRSGDTWDATNWGTCQLAPELAPGLSWVDVTAPPGGLDHQAASIPVGVTEKECSNGRDPGPFLNNPAVVEGTTPSPCTGPATPLHRPEP